MNDTPSISFNQFLHTYNSFVLRTKPPYIRKGQALINYLHEIWPEEYNRISSINYYNETNIDCYYNDKLINNTIKHLKSVWK